MKEAVHKTHNGDEYFSKESCYILEMWNTPEDDAVSIARARVRPGDATKWHRLKSIVERYLVMEGIGRVEIGDLP
jgi:mannose-6-phosphate isomerase-like protein (cupin superfamily)